MEVPDKITSANLFLDSERYENFDPKKEFCRGIIQSHAKVMFHPTDYNLQDQCFELGKFLSAFILVRLVYYRDHCPSTLIHAIPFSLCHTPRDIEEAEKKARETFDAIIEGFWIGVNIDEPTPEQEKKFDDARYLLAKHWKELWC